MNDLVPCIEVDRLLAFVLFIRRRRARDRGVDGDIIVLVAQARHWYVILFIVAQARRRTEQIVAPAGDADGHFFFCLEMSSPAFSSLGAPSFGLLAARGSVAV